MKKTVIILGVLAATGGIAYFILKKRKSKELTPSFSSGGVSTVSPVVGQQGLQTQTIGSSQLVSGIDVPQTANAQIAINEQANLDKANKIASDLRLTYEQINRLNKLRATGSIQLSSYTTQSAVRISRIKSLKAELNKLGYVFEGTTKGTIRKV